MGGYTTCNWYKKFELTFNNEYLTYMHQDAMMACAFGFRKPLFDKIRSVSMFNEYPIINMLEKSYPLSITINNGNLKIEN